MSKVKKFTRKTLHFRIHLLDHFNTCTFYVTNVDLKLKTNPLYVLKHINLFSKVYSLFTVAFHAVDFINIAIHQVTKILYCFIDNAFSSPFSAKNEQIYI